MDVVTITTLSERYSIYINTETGKEKTMTLLLIIILIIGFTGIIGNQYSGLRKMYELQRSLDDLNQKVRTIMNKEK